MQKHAIINTMKELPLKELVKFKKIPFNIYNEKGHILMYTGDLLTPGKLLELREELVLIYDENYQKKSIQARENPLVMKRKLEQENANRQQLLNAISNPNDNAQNESEIDTQIPESIKSRINDRTITKDLTINTKSIFSPDLQIEMKEFYRDVYDEIEVQNYVIAQTKFIKLMKVIEHELMSKISSVRHVSQLKLFGNYKNCHELNVAIISAFIAYTNLDINVDIRDVILSGLMHDIGKTRLDENTVYKKVLYIHEQAEYEKHVIIGYKIIKEIFKLGNAVARPALEHHICTDKSGFPKGLTVENMTEISKIIAVANFYDNLTFNRTNDIIVYNYEAGKILLNIGAKKYPANLVFDLANKYILNDTSKLSEIIAQK